MAELGAGEDTDTLANPNPTQQLPPEAVEEASNGGGGNGGGGAPSPSTAQDNDNSDDVQQRQLEDREPAGAKAPRNAPSLQDMVADIPGAFVDTKGQDDDDDGHESQHDSTEQDPQEQQQQDQNQNQNQSQQRGKKQQRAQAANKGAAVRAKLKQLPRPEGSLLGQTVQNQPRQQQGPQDNCRIFIGNLAAEKTSKQELHRIFSAYGDVTEVALHKSYGFVQFSNSQSAHEAIAGENGRNLGGLTWDMSMAANKRKNSGQGGGPGGGAGGSRARGEHGRDGGPKGTPATRPCVAFAKGECSRGSRCRFSHDVDRGPRHRTPICAEFEMGRCARGRQCRFSHDLPSQQRYSPRPRSRTPPRRSDPYASSSSPKRSRAAEDVDRDRRVKKARTPQCQIILITSQPRAREFADALSRALTDQRIDVDTCELVPQEVRKAFEAMARDGIAYACVVDDIRPPNVVANVHHLKGWNRDEFQSLPLPEAVRVIRQGLDEGSTTGHNYVGGDGRRISAGAGFPVQQPGGPGPGPGPSIMSGPGLGPGPGPGPGPSLGPGPAAGPYGGVVPGSGPGPVAGPYGGGGAPGSTYHGARDPRELQDPRNAAHLAQPHQSHAPSYLPPPQQQQQQQQQQPPPQFVPPQQQPVLYGGGPPGGLDAGPMSQYPPQHAPPTQQQPPPQQYAPQGSFPGQPHPVPQQGPPNPQEVTRYPPQHQPPHGYSAQGGVRYGPGGGPVPGGTPGGPAGSGSGRPSYEPGYARPPPQQQPPQPAPAPTPAPSHVPQNEAPAQALTSKIWNILREAPADGGSGAGSGARPEPYGGGSGGAPYSGGYGGPSPQRPVDPRRPPVNQNASPQSAGYPPQQDAGATRRDPRLAAGASPYADASPYAQGYRPGPGSGAPPTGGGDYPGEASGAYQHPSNRRAPAYATGPSSTADPYQRAPSHQQPQHDYGGGGGSGSGRASSGGYQESPPGRRSFDDSRPPPHQAPHQAAYQSYQPYAQQPQQQQRPGGAAPMSNQDVERALDSLLSSNVLGQLGGGANAHRPNPNNRYHR